MTDEVKIANAALTKLGDYRITSFSDNSEAARVVNARYEGIRDAELRRHTWHFSKARVELAALADAPDFGYSYQYELPADCLRIVSVGDVAPGADIGDTYRTGLDTPDYRIEGRHLLTDLGAPLKLRYIKRVTDPAQFDAAFAESLAARLAYEIALKLTGSRSIKEDAASDYAASVREAIGANAIETPPEPLPDDSWVLAREA